MTALYSEIMMLIVLLEYYAVIIDLFSVTCSMPDL